MKSLKLPEPKYKPVDKKEKIKEKVKIRKEKYLDLLFDDGFINSYFLVINLKKK